MRNESKWANDRWLAVSCDRTDNGLDEAINSVTGRCVGWAYDKENAHLIAAAPELYTALESCMSELLFMINKHNTHNMSDNSYEYDYQTVHEAQMVLAKARGEK